MGYRLNILGKLDLRDADGTVVSSVLQQPRRTALLIYLALADRDGMVKRDTLLGLFWPEMTQEAGRRALSQAIHFLRKSLGKDAIIGRGNDDVALNRTFVDCDAACFVAAARGGELESAAAFYSGDLLPGFFVSGLPEFDQWLSNERESLRRASAEVFWSAAEEAKQTGQFVSAAAYARRAAGLASENESATRRLIEFLESIDDRAGALDAYDGLVRRLQSEYESTPSTKTRDLGERIRRNAGAPLPETPLKISTAARRRSLPWHDIRQRSKTLTGSVIIMVAVLSLWGLGSRDRPLDLRTDGSLVISTPEVFDAVAREPAARIIADAAAALVAVQDLTVYSPSSSATDAANAHFRLEPKVTSDHGELRVSASLIDVTTGKIVKSAAFSAPASDPAAIAAVGLDMSEFARKAMGRYLRATQTATLKDRDAEVLRQAGLARIRSDSLRDQGLADYALLTLQRADSLVERAASGRKSAALLVERAEIAKAKSWIYLLPPLSDKQSADQASGAGAAFAQAAIRLDRSNAAAHEIRGLFAYSHWLAASGGPDAEAHRATAEKFLRNAVELNSQSVKALSALSNILIAKGEFAEAYLAAEHAYAADTYLDAVDAITANLFTAALETGDIKSATVTCADMTRRSHNGWISAYCKLQLLARVDRPTDAQLRGAQLLVESMSRDPMNAPFISVLYSILGVVHAKAGHAAAAATLVARQDAGPMRDETLPFKAWALMEMGGEADARSLLDEYVRSNPSHRAGVLRSVRFASLR
jgi:DNA-binding SARP family transcriptional activator